MCLCICLQVLNGRSCLIGSEIDINGLHLSVDLYTSAVPALRHTFFMLRPGLHYNANPIGAIRL